MPRWPKRSLEERFAEKLAAARSAAGGSPDACWPFQGALTGNGYGHLRRGRADEGFIYAHVLSFELHHGPVPDGHEVDHRCRNRACINPAHLRALTHRENCLAGEAPAIVLHRAGRCKRGHPASQRYTRPNGTSGYCNTCRRELRRARGWR